MIDDRKLDESSSPLYRFGEVENKKSSFAVHPAGELPLGVTKKNPELEINEHSYLVVPPQSWVQALEHHIQQQRIRVIFSSFTLSRASFSSSHISLWHIPAVPNLWTR
eukprot:scaffold1361_cov165-Amphora_coffeaeformis.AAC.7